ncbi:hypothetical protein ACLX1H_004965 [Fusarium chlamydosporum]
MYLRRSEEHHETMELLDDASRSVEIQSILIAFSVLSTLIIALRAYIRLILLRSFGWDDGVMVIAQVLALGAAAAIGLENKYGLGYHSWAQPKSAYVPYMKSFYASVIIYNLSLCLIKIGILLQIRRAFAIPIMKTITFYGTAVMIAWSVTIVFLNVLICIPVAKFWNHDMPGKCLNPLTIWYLMASVNLVTDFAIFCLPLPVIKSLNLPRKQKIMLFAIFSLGLFTCVISIYRIRTLKTAAATKDPNWDNVDAAIWSFIEVTNAIIAACLPTLRPLMSRLMPQIFGSSLGRSNRASSYGQSFDGRFQRNQARIRIISHDKEASEDEYILCDDNAPSSSITKGTHDSHRPAVSVSIEAGNRVFDEKNEVHIRGMEGITTRTVITQQVASELIPEEGDCEVRDTKL